MAPLPKDTISIARFLFILIGCVLNTDPAFKQNDQSNVAGAILASDPAKAPPSMPVMPNPRIDGLKGARRGFRIQHSRIGARNVRSAKRKLQAAAFKTGALTTKNSARTGAAP
jgi:hypothetical protein